MANVLNQNLAVMGRALDECEELGSTLLLELFPDTMFSEDILIAFEETFDVPPVGDFSARRNAVIAAHRTRGGLSQQYFEGRGNTMGLRQVDPYTVVLSPGTGDIPFVIATYSSTSSPQGPATLLPGMLTDGPWDESPYTIIVIVTGVAGPETQLEKKFNRLVPAWCNFTFTYVP